MGHSASGRLYAVLGKETIFENTFSGNNLLESYNLLKAYLGPNKTTLDLIELKCGVGIVGYSVWILLEVFHGERKYQYWPSSQTPANEFL